jgi:hypothetical protein
MTQFYIPACGDRLILEKDWEFDLCLEHRNMKFATSQGFFKTENHNLW